VTTANSDPPDPLSAVAVAARVRAAVAVEGPKLELGQIYRRAQQLPHTDDDLDSSVADQPADLSPQPAGWETPAPQPMPSARSPWPHDARWSARRGGQALLAGGWRLWRWALGSAVVIGLAVPYLWTQIAALTVVAITVTTLAAAAFNE
jgi:anti-sigma-K factor RskA